MTPHRAPGRFNWRAFGIVVAVLSLPAAAGFALLALLTANACGMFADGCDDYGKPAAGFSWFVAGTCLAITAFVVGVAIALFATVNRRASDRPHP